MTATQSVQLYQVLQEHFGNTGNAAKAVTAIEAIIDAKVEDGNRQYETLLHKDLEILRSEMKEQNSRLETKIAETSTSNLRWVFSFFIAIALMIIGLYIKK